MKIILGTMTFGTGSGGRISDRQTIKEILRIFHSHGGIELDTARMYCNGNTEEVLGELQVQTAEPHFKVATKAFPFEPGMHQPEKLKEQFKTSLKALGTNKVDLFYLHAPDRVTPFEDTLKAVNELYNEGHFVEFGLSNYSSWEVVEIWWICKTNGYVLPTVYQGMYNGITRDIERELFPAIRKLGIRFYAYNPLAGGILSGKLKPDQDAESGARFDSQTVQGRKYRERFWKDPYFQAVDHINAVCKQHNITLVSAAHRWLLHHSLLDTSKGDGLIIGVSSLEHGLENIQVCEEGPLPSDVVEAFNNGWLTTKGVVQNYFR